MSTREELQATLRSYLRDQMTLEDLELWLAGSFQALHDEGDEEFEGIANDAWILINEHWNQALALDDLHRDLAELIAVRTTD